MLKQLKNKIAKGSLLLGSLLLILLSSTSGAMAASGEAHEFHVCITRIEYNPATKGMEITLKIFTDDLERALEDQGAPRLFIGGPREHAQTDSLIQNYLQDKFSLFINRSPEPWQFVGKEVELDVTWCYLEILTVAPPHNITIRNQVLMDRFEDQMNLVHVYVHGEKQSLALKKGHFQESVSF